MVRAAAKNFHDVLVSSTRPTMTGCSQALAAEDGAGPAFRFDLARKALRHTAAYDTDDRQHPRHRRRRRDGSCARAGRRRRAAAPRAGVRARQRAALRREPAPEGGAGTPPGRARASAPWTCCRARSSRTPTCSISTPRRASSLEFDEPAAAVIKHTNPCGVATGASAATAYVTARDADALSAFGGIVGLNRPLDADAARAITSTFIEAVVAPAVDAEALADPGEEAEPARARRRLRAFARARRQASTPVDPRRPARAGARPRRRGARAVARRRRRAASCRHHAGRLADEWQALRFAWRVCAHVKSNTISSPGRIARARSAPGR